MGVKHYGSSPDERRGANISQRLPPFLGFASTRTIVDFRLGSGFLITAQTSGGKPDGS
jgi:hypothetical protein